MAIQATTSSTTSGSFALIAFAMLACSPDAPGEDVEWLIQTVEQHERLYADLDVRLTTTYERGATTPIHPDAYVRRTEQLTYVSQAGMYRSDYSIAGELNGGRNYDFRSQKAFDGSKTRSLQNRSLANIKEGPGVDGHAVRPHMLLHPPVFVPMSVWLRGPEAVAAHPSGEPVSDIDTEVSYIGLDAIDGLNCHQIRLTSINRASGAPVTRREFWLAEDRNYLPLRQHSFAVPDSPIPTAIGHVTNLQEISPGIWFPMTASFTAYNTTLVADEGRQVLQWKETYVATDVSLKPQYPPAYFSDVPFPDGAAVYEVSQDGNIKRGHRQGQVTPRARAAPASVASPWWKLLLWLNALAAAAIVVIAMRRRARRGRSTSASNG